jgi:hypothetical protein
MMQLGVRGESAGCGVSGCGGHVRRGGSWADR